MAGVDRGMGGCEVAVIEEGREGARELRAEEAYRSDGRVVVRGSHVFQIFGGDSGGSSGHSFAINSGFRGGRHWRWETAKEQTNKGQSAELAPEITLRSSKNNRPRPPDQDRPGHHWATSD